MAFASLLFVFGVLPLAILLVGAAGYVLVFGLTLIAAKWVAPLFRGPRRK